MDDHIPNGKRGRPPRLHVAPGVTVVVTDRQPTVGTDIHVLWIVGIDANPKGRRLTALRTRHNVRERGGRPGEAPICAHVDPGKTRNTAIIEGGGKHPQVDWTDRDIPGGGR